VNVDEAQLASNHTPAARAMRANCVEVLANTRLGSCVAATCRQHGTTRQTADKARKTSIGDFAFVYTLRDFASYIHARARL
jgi:hypothetical protein